MTERALLVRIDGELLSDQEARELWGRFSAYMEAHRGDLGGFAKSEGLASIRPSFEDGAAILLASHSEAQTPYRNVTAEPPSTKPKPEGTRNGSGSARSTHGSGKIQAGAKSHSKKR